jgi:hypothetical protein
MAPAVGAGERKRERQQYVESEAGEDGDGHEEDEKALRELEEEEARIAHKFVHDSDDDSDGDTHRRCDVEREREGEDAATQPLEYEEEEAAEKKEDKPRGGYHLQIYVQFRNRLRDKNRVIKALHMPPRWVKMVDKASGKWVTDAKGEGRWTVSEAFHVEGQRGTAVQARSYVVDDEKKTNIGTVVEWGEFDPAINEDKHQGERADIHALRKKIKSGEVKTEFDLARRTDSAVLLQKYNKPITALLQGYSRLRAVKLLVPPQGAADPANDSILGPCLKYLQTDLPDPRLILWIWSEKGGTGKSTAAKWLYNWILANKKKPVFKCGAGKDVDVSYSYNCEDYIIIDIPRSGSTEIPYRFMEMAKDGAVTSSKYQSSVKAPEAGGAWIIVFANEGPDLYKCGSKEVQGKDRFITINIDPHGPAQVRPYVPVPAGAALGVPPPLQEPPPLVPPSKREEKKGEKKMETEEYERKETKALTSAVVVGESREKKKEKKSGEEEEEEVIPHTEWVNQGRDFYRDPAMAAAAAERKKEEEKVKAAKKRKGLLNQPRSAKKKKTEEEKKEEKEKKEEEAKKKNQRVLPGSSTGVGQLFKRPKGLPQVVFQLSLS